MPIADIIKGEESVYFENLKALVILLYEHCLSGIIEPIILFANFIIRTVATNLTNQHTQKHHFHNSSKLSIIKKL